MLNLNLVTITVPSRIHITLIDLGTSGYRRGGGIGFCINGFDAQFTFSKSAAIDLSKLQSVGYARSETDEIESSLRELRNRQSVSGLTLEKCTMPPRHTGLGTGTSTALACVEALSSLNRFQLSRSEIVKFSGRGGMSGIGVNTYFDGGFVVDGGRAFYSQKMKSSDEIQPLDEPLLLMHFDMPSWKLVVITFGPEKSVSSVTEKKLFDTVLPLQNDQVFHTAYHSIFGVAAAAVDEKFETFCDAINSIQQCAWKNSEISIHGPWVREIMANLRIMGATAVGMSSVGPCLYCFALDVPKLADAIAKKMPRLSAKIVTVRNFGRVVDHG